MLAPDLSAQCAQADDGETTASRIVALLVLALLVASSFGYVMRRCCLAGPEVINHR